MAAQIAESKLALDDYSHGKEGTHSKSANLRRLESGVRPVVSYIKEKLSRNEPPRPAHKISNERQVNQDQDREGHYHSAKREIKLEECRKVDMLTYQQIFECLRLMLRKILQ